MQTCNKFLTVSVTVGWSEHSNVAVYWSKEQISGMKSWILSSLFLMKKAVSFDCLRIWMLTKFLYLGFKDSAMARNSATVMLCTSLGAAVWSSCIIPHYQGREGGQGCDNLEIIICKGTSEKWIQGNSAFCRCFVTIQTMTMKVSTSKDQVRIKYATSWQFRLRNLSKSNHFRMREWIILWLTWNSLIW